MTEIAALRENMAALTRRAAVDAEFRALCLNDADAAYRELTGLPLPEHYNPRFAEPGYSGGAAVILPPFLPPTWLTP